MIDRTTIATSIHPASADAGVNLNRGKQKGQRLPDGRPTGDYRPPRARRFGSTMTVIQVNPAALRASRAHTKSGNVSERMIDSGDVVARRVKSRAAIRKLRTES